MVTAMGCGAGDEQSIPADWRLVEAAAPDDTTLRIEVLGGGCDADDERLGRIDVTETADRVGVLAFIAKPESTARDCPSIGTSHAATVELDEPLGDRQLTGCDVTNDLRRPPEDCGGLSG